MQRERITNGSHAAMVAGWASNVDALFVVLILTLAVTMVAAARLDLSQGKNRQLQSDISQLQTQLEQRQDHVTNLEAERERLIELGRQRINTLTANVVVLQAKNAELTKATMKANDERARLETDIQQLAANVATWRDSYIDAKNSLEQVAGEKQEAAIRLVSAIDKHDRARRELTSLRIRIDAEPGLHKELIGLKGPMRRVVIVFDTSGSMSREGRWEHARGVVATWLEHLAISECALVLFSTDVHVFPQDGGFLDVRGVEGATNRKRLLDRIKVAKPEGGTSTLLALQTAYRCQNVDSVILFTDGEPNSNSNQFDPEVAEKIYTLCQQHKDIPVNTVGLGNYFQPQLSGFLMRVAQETGGSFLGR